MKLAIFTDLHANFPALEAALLAIDKLGYDLIVHTGDAIAIGPHPAECLERLLGLENGRYSFKQHAVPYDDRDVGSAFAARQVPDRDFICRTFYGDRWKNHSSR